MAGLYAGRMGSEDGMRFTVAAVVVGLVSVLAGTFLWLGLAAVLIVAGVFLVAGGLLIDLEDE